LRVFRPASSRRTTIVSPDPRHLDGGELAAALELVDEHWYLRRVPLRPVRLRQQLVDQVHAAATQQRQRREQRADPGLRNHGE
jgi:hypothetical protein